MRYLTIRLLALLAAVVFQGTSESLAQRTWDPDGNQTSDGGDGTWDLASSNWDDNGSAPNVAWTQGGDAIFGAKADGSVSTIDLAAFAGVTVDDITLSPGNGAVRLVSGFDGDGLVVASGGATWELGGRQLHFANNDILYANDTALFMTTGDTLTITDSVGGGVFNTGERPGGADWLTISTNNTLDIKDGVTVRGNAASVGKFATVKMRDGTTHIHERNAAEGYGNNWEIEGDVTFDNRFSRASILNGVVSDGASAGRMIVANHGGSLVRLSNPANSFSGGVLIDSTITRSELDTVFGVADTAMFGAVPGTFAADNITLRNGGEIKLRGQTINANRGITLDGGGIIVLNSTAATYGGTISGDGGLQIGRTQGSDGNTLVLTSNTHTYTGNTRIFQGSLQLGADNVIPTDQVLTIGGKGGSRLRMEGFDQEITGLQTAANNTREVVNDGVSVSTLTINTAADTSYTYNGNFSGASTVAIVKNGDGTQIINRNSNTTTAPDSITVNGGRMRINNPILDDDPNSTSTPTALMTAVTVNSGGTFVLDAGQATPNDGIGWDEEEIDVLMANATFNAGSILGINTGGGDFTYNSNLSGSQGLYKIQTNTLTLTGTNSYAGPTFVENGTLMADSPAALPNTGLTVQGDAGPGFIGFNLDNWSEAQVDARINAANTTFDANAGVELGLSSNASYSQVIPANVTNFAVSGTGATLNLTAANAYTGSTTIRGGTVVEGVAGAIPNGTLLTLGEGANDARLDTGGTDQSVTGLQSSSTGNVQLAVGSIGGQTLTIDVADGESYSYAGRLGGTAGIFDNNFSVVKNGTGTQNLTGVNAYTGTTAINAGRLVIARALDAAALNPGDVTIAAGAEVILEGEDFGANGEWTDAQIQSFLANQNFSAGRTTFGIQTQGAAENLSFTGVVTGNKNFVKTGNQTLFITQAQTYTGDTHVAAGTVDLSTGGANPLPTGTVLTIGSPNAGTTVLFNGSSQELGGLVTGGSGSGNRRIANGSATAMTLTLNVAGGESYVYNHTIGANDVTDGNNLSLVKSGAGTQTLLHLSHTGTTSVTAGTLLINGGASGATGAVTVSSGATLGGIGTLGGAVTAQSGSSVAPGTAAGTLNLLSDFNLNAGASLDFELSGTDQTVGGGVNDLINMSGATGQLNLNGTLNVAALVNSNADFNSDGSVDGLDLDQWQGDYGLNGDSDANGDMESTGLDFLSWQRDFGLSGDFSGAMAGDSWTLITYDDANVALTNNLTLGSLPTLGAGLQFQLDDSTLGQIDLQIVSLLSATAVPEPSTIVLFTLSSIGLLGRRRRAVR